MIERLTDAIGSGAALTLLGVFAGAFLTLAIDSVRSRVHRRDRGADLARRVVVLLDAHIEELASWCQLASQPELGLNPPLPEPLVMPDGIDLSAIDSALAYDLLKLAPRQTSIRRSVRFLADVVDHDAATKEAHSELATQAHAANACAERLRRECGLPGRDPDVWDPMSWFHGNDG